MKNKGRIIKHYSVKYEWQCPNCPDAGVCSSDLDTVKYCRSIHKCGKVTEEDR